MSYGSVAQVEAGYRELDADEYAKCEALLDEASILIDSTGTTASCEVKAVVACRMVRRAISDGEASVPMGATQGTVSAGGYSQSWTVGSSGTTGELYIGRSDRKLLGLGNAIGAGNPLIPTEVIP